MQEGDIGVIVNPQAAGGRAGKAIPRATNALRSIGAPFTLSTTSGRMDAWKMARDFAEAGAERVIAIGGDGTFNEAANGLLEATRPVPLGIVAAGTGCDLPRTLGIPTKSVADGVIFAATQGPRIMDVGIATSGSGATRHFLNVAGLGFDATVAERASRTKLPGPKVSYLAATGISLKGYKNIPVRIEIDGESIETRAVFVTVANAQYFGGGFHIAPMADITDGKLDLAIVGDLSLVELLQNIPSVYRGKHTGHPKFTHRSITHVRISSTEHALVQVDGEIFGEAPVEFAVKPSSFAIIA